MNKYLLTAIISTSVLFTFCILYRYVLIGFNLTNAFAEYSFLLMIIGCIVACIVCLVFGAKGFREKEVRGQSIATAIISLVGILFI